MLALGSVVAVAAAVTIALSPPPPVSDCPDPTLPCAPPIAEQPLSTAVAGPAETPRPTVPAPSATVVPPSATAIPSAATPVPTQPPVVPSPSPTPQATAAPTSEPTASTTAPSAIPTETPQASAEPTAPSAAPETPAPSETPAPTEAPTEAPSAFPETPAPTEAPSPPPLPPPASPTPRVTLPPPSLSPIAMPTPRPPSTAALAPSGTVWQSSEFGFSLQYDPSLWTVRSETERELVLVTRNGAVLAAIRARPAIEASPADMLADQVARASATVLGFTPETDARFLPPGLPVMGYRTGVGGTYRGTVDTPQGPSVVVRIGMIVASDGTVTVSAAILAPSNIRRGAFQIADSLMNAFEWPEPAL